VISLQRRTPPQYRHFRFEPRQLQYEYHIAMTNDHVVHLMTITYKLQRVFVVWKMKERSERGFSNLYTVFQLKIGWWAYFQFCGLSTRVITGYTCVPEKRRPGSSGSACALELYALFTSVFTTFFPKFRSKIEYLVMRLKFARWHFTSTDD